MFVLAAYFEPHEVQRWLVAGGYGALFGLLFSCGLGFPLPEDVPLIASGILIADHRMHLAIAAPLAWLGIVGGDCILYAIGHRYGNSIVKIPLIGKHITQRRLDRAENLFRKYGAWMVAVGRMFMGIRGAMIVAAGTSRLKFHKFIIADGLAAIVSGGLFMVLGYWGGKDGRVIGHRVRIFRHTMWATAGVLAIILIIFFFWRDRRRSSRADGDASAVPASRQ
ncbi:MAG TPA: DedA family protein [Tepidisphaeraceae bacterium]|jgi:membrane protein DedA with SNARE-associated domain|nr:DedA family protein [Tepidisphaeraceae bacterium]